ncbi:MAG: hypothetical protein JJT76_17530 [Clostridiaceae bacterium]|nr:hypothetical protein [Clostridiaceae bacterium]
MPNKKTPRRRRFKIDGLRCKKVVIQMIIERETCTEISEAISSLGESCSPAAVDRYRRNKFVQGTINADRTIELVERQGNLLKVTKYPAGEDNFDYIESKLSTPIDFFS